MQLRPPPGRLTATRVAVENLDISDDLGLPSRIPVHGLEQGQTFVERRRHDLCRCSVELLHDCRRDTRIWRTVNRRLTSDVHLASALSIKPRARRLVARRRVCVSVRLLSHAMNSTFGASFGARTGVGHVGVDSSAVRPITPGKDAPDGYSLIGMSIARDRRFECRDRCESEARTITRDG